MEDVKLLSAADLLERAEGLRKLGIDALERGEARLAKGHDADHFAEFSDRMSGESITLACTSAIVAALDRLTEAVKSHPVYVPQMDEKGVLLVRLDDR